MTKNILICNKKGGVGKSTLADLLLWSFEKDGIPASFYDLDGQGGVIHKPIEVDNAAVAVVDTPGALQKELGSWINSADLIIIPTKATMLDMTPLLRMIDMVKNAACPVIYVEMMWNRFTAAASFDEWLSTETNGKSALLRIPQSEMIVQASAMGMSVIDYAPKSSVAEAAKEFVQHVRSVIQV